MTVTRDKLLTRPLRREKRINMGPLGFVVEVDVELAEKIRRSLPYRLLVRRVLTPTGLGSAARRPPAVSANYHAGMPILKPDLTTSASVTPEARANIDKISEYSWYHTIDLPHGVTTPGYVDHRGQLPYYHLPADMTGMRVLDVATFDGFWAFEFERRGAQVVAIDLASTEDVDILRNWRATIDPKTFVPKGEGFRIAHEILGSRVQKEVCSVYDVSPERLGMFDMVFCSDLLIHLRDPLAAMEAIWTVTKDFAVFADVYHPELDAFGENALVEYCMVGQSDIWWRPSVTCYNYWLRVARFARVEEKSRFVLEAKFHHEIPKVVLHAYR